MVEAIVSTIVEKLKDLVIDKASEAWKLVRGVEEEVKRLKSNLEELQLVLEDAETKKYRNERLKQWLDKFEDACYDMEDVLDDWKTDVLQELQTPDSSAPLLCWKLGTDGLGSIRLSLDWLGLAAEPSQDEPLLSQDEPR
ncbi:disease resistance protein RGA1 [Canna indica]|uniref:Disease resistance protein RGA1 n=1 Tax=Canna indica TaxID=4628 RepID=A0AAQ3K632_9LILI|nr:disease resistance protein RGA1 [Canna indica]